MKLEYKILLGVIAAAVLARIWINYQDGRPLLSFGTIPTGPGLLG